MRGVSKPLVALATIGLLALALSACGGSDSDDSTAAPSGEGGADFRSAGGDNSIQDFGEEPDREEIDAADTVLSNYMRARAEDDWKGQCAGLAAATMAPLEKLAAQAAQFKAEGCAPILEALLSDSPASTRANTMTAGIASLRVEGDRAFALYHGAEDVDYFVPMVKEDGEWKIGAIAPSEFP